MKFWSADKARKRTNKYCLLNEKHKKRELRSKVKEERRYLKYRIKLACENESHIICGISIKHTENIYWLQQLNYSVVETPVFHEYTVSWEEQENDNGKKNM